MKSERGKCRFSSIVITPSHVFWFRNDKRQLLDLKISKTNLSRRVSQKAVVAYIVDVVVVVVVIVIVIVVVIVCASVQLMYYLLDHCVSWSSWQLLPELQYPTLQPDLKETHRHTHRQKSNKKNTIRVHCYTNNNIWMCSVCKETTETTKHTKTIPIK